MSKVEPFLRWAGGKSWLVEWFSAEIQKISIENYYEPFLGGGAVFFSLRTYGKAYLSDINSELINLYMQVRDNHSLLINSFQQFKNDEASYYKIRKAEFSDAVERAARFLYLNQTSYNGLYRVNKDGKYNVPYGFRRNWIYDVERIVQASNRLQGVDLTCCDFMECKSKIKRNDLVFLDPPYTVSHNNNGFIEYNKNLFSLGDQERLCDFIRYIRNQGAYYILTNAAHPTIKEIFNIPEDRMIPLKRKSLIGGKNSCRGEIEEYIFTNIPEGVSSSEQY